MPSRNTHALVSSFAGALIGGYLEYENQIRQKQQNPYFQISGEKILLSSAGSALAGALGGLLPDMLEPADSPHHRKTFHSYALLGILFAAMYKARSSVEANIIRNVIIALMGGYGTHQIQDATTPKGLPWI